jgi:hypothetical protein
VPLEEGSGNDAVSANVSTLMKEGYPQRQSVAIALSKAGRSNKKKKRSARHKAVRKLMGAKEE